MVAAGGGLTLLLFLFSSCRLLYSVQAQPWSPSPASKPHRVAIIGAGAAGTSAAYWLARASNRSKDVTLEVDVFEREGYIGGRSTVVFPHNSKAYHPVEVGASIFIAANKNLVRAAQEFNLSLADYGEQTGGYGVWDGAHFRFQATMTENGFTQEGINRLVARYGSSAPTQTQQLTQSMVDSYLSLYNISTPDWNDVAGISAFINFTRLTTQTTETYLRSQGVNEKYIVEMVEAATRVNYAQNANSIHALGGLVSQAATGASSISGGNYHIFEEFLRRSNAKVHLNTSIKSLGKSGSRWLLKTSTSSVPQLFDSVILAAPFHLSNITVLHRLQHPIPTQPYIHLHVTLFTTTASSPHPSYFYLKNGTTAPVIVLTTNDGYTHGGPKPEFNSMSYEGFAAFDFKSKLAEYVVKIFSQERISDKWLKDVFGKIDWVYRKEWDSYPLLTPTGSFPPVVPDNNLYYVNSFEPFISTMETETISSSNIVRLLLQNIFGPKVISCDSTKTRSASGEIMKGWDC